MTRDGLINRPGTGIGRFLVCLAWTGNQLGCPTYFPLQADLSYTWATHYMHSDAGSKVTVACTHSSNISMSMWKFFTATEVDLCNARKAKVNRRGTTAGNNKPNQKL